MAIRESTTASKPKAITDLIVTIELTQEEKNNSELRKGRLKRYVVPAKVVELADSVHAEIEQLQFDKQGKKTSHPYVLKVNARTWLKWRTKALLMGFVHVRVLYCPKGVDKHVFTLADIQKKATRKI